MTLHPVSFAEYLRAADAQLYHSYQMIDEVMAVPGVAPAADRCLQVVSCVRRNAQAVSAYIDTRSWAEVKVVQVLSSSLFP